MKIILSVFLSILSATFIHAQVKIGGAATNPHASSILELDGGTSRGFLLPRMTTANMNAMAGPAEGLMIYNTTDKAVFIRTNNAWVKAGTGSGFTLPFEGETLANLKAGFKVLNTGFAGSGIHGQTEQGTLGTAGVIGEAISGGIGIKGVSHNGMGGYFNSRNNYALVADTGSVGLGTRTPQALVEVNGLKTNDLTMLLHDENPVVQFRNKGGNGLPMNKGFLQLNNDDIKIGTNFDNSDGQFIIRMAGADRVFVNNTGRVGIGTDTSSAKLEISALNSSDPTLVLNDQSPTIFFRNTGVDKGFVQATGDDLKIGNPFSNATGKFIIRTGGLDRVFVNNMGRMSIGTDSSTAKLEINALNNSDPALILNDESPTIHFRNNGIDKGFLQVTGNDLKIGNPFSNAAGKFIIRTGGLDRVFVDNNGNMSIGSSQVASGYRLNIDGKVMAEEMRIQNSTAWPDYVFKSDYKLLSLSEIKTFIAKNNRLPGIPAAAEIEKEGIPVGKMQTLMMEKIEELTLHLIKAQEQIEQLQQQTKKLSASK